MGLIEDYRQGLLPLIVLLTLLKHHLSRYLVPEWVHQQVYLHPYPKELMLRNHVWGSWPLTDMRATGISSLHLEYG